MRSALVAFLVSLFPVSLSAQMAVSGRVTVGDQAIQGATVGIPALNVETRTNAQGVYNFLVSSAQVRGQTVELVARHRRFGSRAVQIALTGGSIVHNFELTAGERPADQPVVPRPGRPAPPTPSMPTVERSVLSALSVDSAAFAETAGSFDFTGALAGRIPGLIVTSASTSGGSSLMIHRGARSLAGSVQPLVVLDGVPLDNSSTPSGPAQAFGLGGFDYGSPLQNLAMDDIAVVTLLRAADATPLYGSRAANGVLLITTKQATEIGVQYSARARYITQSAVRLPSYQNAYGQGLGGQFEFFDGQGAGINDAADQSWGPALDGRPIAQASLTEPRRPDVRHWLPHTSGVRDYFDGGRAIDAGVSLQGARGANRGRASITATDARGPTPGASTRRIGVGLNGVSQPSSRLTATAHLRLTSSSAEHRPGTGFDEINPVAGFTRMGRQVDLDALRANVQDADGEQINWIYTARNNPFFQTLENSNDDKQAQLIGGARLTFAFSPSFRATVHAGTDDHSERRNFLVAEGWKGEYPTYIGREDLRGGGAQGQTLKGTERIAGVSLDAASQWSGLSVNGVAGFDSRRSELETKTTVTVGASDGRPGLVASDEQSAPYDLSAFYLAGALSPGSWLTITAGARVERSSSFSDALGSAIFPSFSATYDAAKKVGALRSLGLGTARVRASWWRAGNEVTPRTLARTYAGGGTPASPTLGVATGDAIPERTAGLELSTELSTVGNRLGLDLTAYRERSSELLVGALSAQTAQVLNSGFELQLRAVPFSAVLGPRWDVAASFARNTSTVEELGGGVSEVPMSPPIWGALLTARKGSPIGSIVGTKYLRDGNGELLLSNGLPSSDGSLSVLGSWQPDWTTSVQSRLRLGSAELALLFDARFGGKIFSATNLWGSYAGTLASTVASRETGMVVPGIDIVTSAPNVTNVSVEDYFHSLASIHEAWVFDASYAKLREVRMTYEVPLTFFPGLRRQVGRFSIMGRNLLTFAKAPNIDPETTLSSGPFQGFEMGQLPSTRSVAFVLSVAP